MRTPAGFLLPMNNQNNTFEKPPLSIGAQIERLASRGIIIRDKDTALHYLTYISYYRFCGYAIEFEDEVIDGEKRYRNGTTFEQILDCYIFDRKLRLLIINAIERIEVAVRTVIVNELGLKYQDAHWYLNKSLFISKFKHDNLIQSIKKQTKERFIEHYYNKYSTPALPAVWMVGEVLSLGSWSMIFAHLKNREDQKIICNHFGISYKVMESWLHSLTYLRNLCAHHSKLWSRNFTLKPMIATGYVKQLMVVNRFSSQAAVLKIFLDVISPGSGWAEQLRKLVNEHPLIDIGHMGFHRTWTDDPFWN